MIRPARDQRGFTKIPYKEWEEFRRSVSLLRQYLSWTEISSALGKVNRGWAANAYEHRSIVSPRDVKLTQKLAKSYLAKGEISMLENSENRKTALSDEEAKKMLQYLDTLLAYYRPTELGRLLGAKSRSAIASIKSRGGYCTRKTFEAAEKLVANLPTKEVDLMSAEANTVDNNVVTTNTLPQAASETSNTVDAFAWLAQVEKALLDIAILIDNEAAKVPQGFRGPYELLKDKLLSVAQEFQR